MLLDIIPGTGFICLTFKTDSKAPSYLLSNWKAHDPYFSNFEILVDTESICVHGYTSKKPIAYEMETNAKEWTTLFLEYTVKDKEIYFHYFLLNADEHLMGEFSFDAPILSRGGYSLGSRHDDSTENSFSGYVACLEFYHNPSQERFPPDIRMVISEHQKVELLVEPQSTGNGAAKRKRVESEC